jgi:hypothetical protein
MKKKSLDNPSNNYGGRSGKQDMEGDKLRMAAVAPKGRHKQKRGGAASNAKAHYSKSKKQFSQDSGF